MTNLTKLRLTIICWILYSTILNLRGQIYKPNELHQCDRRCNPSQPPKTCFYSLDVTYTRTMNPTMCGKCPSVPEDCFNVGCAVADGSLRPLYMTNNLFPGPEIRVCEDDILVINVTNSLLSGESLTIHWHGMHQKSTPFMDGIPMISQCGILTGNTFQYVFRATPAGTHFWHGHVSLLRDHGLAGALVVRTRNPLTQTILDPIHENDLNRAALIQDWSPVFYPPYFVREPSPLNSILVNGKQNNSYFVYHRPILGGSPAFLRIISNGFLYCPISLTIDGHKLTIVRSDGHSLEPVTVNQMFIFASERYDIFFEPSEEESRLLSEFSKPSVYAMHWRGVGACVQDGIASNATSFLIYTPSEPQKIGLSQALTLIENYQEPTINRVSPILFSKNNGLDLRGSDGKRSLGDPFKVYNPADYTEFSKNESIIKLTDLRALPSEYQSKSLMGPNVHKIFLFVDSSIGNELPNINNISFAHPTFPLMSQFDEIPKHEFCNWESNPECSSKKVCHCINIYQFRLNSIVELILVDEGHNGKRDTHTFHLHGYSFAVLAQEKLAAKLRVDEIKKLDAMGKLNRNFDRPIYKDTVSVPEGGYAIVRFKADNPGFWIMHCHLAFHLLGGMAVVFKVGDYDQMVPPPFRFPRCGSWYPDSNLAL